METKRYLSLDAFRGLCAVSVVLFHARISESITEIEFFRGSYLFVEFFFVLSGFVLAHSYGNKNDFNIRKFILSRFYRIYPLHLFMLIVFLLLETAKYIGYVEFGIVLNNLPFTNFFSPTELLPNVFLLHAWLPQFNPLSFNYPSWSISVEFYLYVIFSFIMLFHKYLRLFVWFTISAIALLLLTFEQDFPTQAALRGLACFFSGCFVYILHKKTERYLKLSFVLLSIVEIILMLTIYYFIVNRQYFLDVFYVPLFCLTVYIFSFESGSLSLMLKFKIFQYLGKISYSIYMTHAALIFCFISAFLVYGKVFNKSFVTVSNGNKFIDLGSVFANNFVVLLLVVVVLVVSTFTYNKIELSFKK